MDQAILKVTDLRIHYHTRTSLVKAVDGVNFEVRRGEIFGLVGESGSGKSTLCYGLLRLIFPPGKIENGNVTFGGQDLLAMDPETLRRTRWERIAYIPQGAMSALNPVTRIRNQFYDTMRDHGIRESKDALDERIKGLLARVHLAPDVMLKFPHELSGGMKQRVCISLAIILNPELIIADEPTSALDVVSQRVVLETLAREQARSHTSMILVGHDMALQAQIANRLGIMFAGRFVEIGDVRDIFDDPIHPYTQRLVSSVPSINKKQDIHALAKVGLTEADKYRQRISSTMIEVKPGHFVAEG